jgi:hypothetical protein
MDEREERVTEPLCSGGGHATDGSEEHAHGSEVGPRVLGVHASAVPNACGVLRHRWDCAHEHERRTNQE